MVQYLHRRLKDSWNHGAPNQHVGYGTRIQDTWNTLHTCRPIYKIKSILFWWIIWSNPLQSISSV
ncbi:hypothetical protein I79_021325 [Cricetulus griseus]|uniref:Uncharacterized protein n=1 Tax=Cricetulus griseus TaxID=10029 RepID=G3ICD2_CRIGR|nr:hypothetical protein I79_021325 [Cricetulus griseus]